VLPAREQEASSDELDATEREESCLVAVQRQLQTVPRGVCNRTNYAAENLGNPFKYYVKLRETRILKILH